MTILETKRLILRKPKESDWKDIVEGVREYDVAKMLSKLTHPYKKKDAEIFIKKTIKNWQKKVKKDYTFLIALKSEKKVIGGHWNSWNRQFFWDWNNWFLD